MKSLYLCIGTCFLLFLACRDPKDIYYRLDHTQWFVYNEGDTLMFKGNDTLYDTYAISSIDNFFDNWGDDGNLHTEYLIVSYEAISKCTNCPIQSFSRTYTNVGFSGELAIRSISYNDQAIEYTLGDSLLQNIYVLDNLQVDTVNFKVKTIYYSDICGIIRYDLFDDRVYELQLE